MQRILNAMYADPDPEPASGTSNPGPALPINTNTSLPIIGAAWDEQVHVHTVPVAGISIVRHSARKELEFLNRAEAKQIARNEDHGNGNGHEASIDVSISSNAPFLESLWDCLQHYVTTAPPVTDLSTSVTLATARAKAPISLPPLKIDVVADGGRRWVRLFTLKPSSLLQEFRLVEAEEVDDSSDEDDGEALPVLKSKTNRLAFDMAAQRCSLVRTALELRRAADYALTLQSPSAADSVPIKVDLILTRLDWPESVPDFGSEGRGSMRDFNEGDRFQLRLDCILNELCLIPHLQVHTSRSPTFPLNDVIPKRQKPIFLPKDDIEDTQTTRHLNLDLSALVALASDIIHGNPISDSSTLEQSQLCFHTTAPYKLIRSTEPPSKPGVQNGAHGRALAEQLWRECCHGVEDGGDFLHSLIGKPPGSEETPNIIFWTTREAADKFFEIVDLVAGEQEKRRALALLNQDGPVAQLQEDFWRESRWAVDLHLRKHLQLPVRIFEEHPAREMMWTDPISQMFVDDLESIVSRNLAAQDEKVSKTNAPSSALERLDIGNISNSPTMASGPGPTAHTSRSLLAGCRNGMTTLTTNFTSVKWLVRQWPGANEPKQTSTGYSSSAWPTLPNSLGLIGKYYLHHDQLLSTPSTQSAVIWVLHPRSFAEQMRDSSNGVGNPDVIVQSSN
ncbi:unnamed protein product [Tilletia laevis]|nr:hypothetical protein CF335_g7175 [Tilletia laevis]CAD6906180.1 unnamed protein product [Tilletia laevis]CAD7059894.1 unnamed protein product [Tilletia caries]